MVSFSTPQFSGFSASFQRVWGRDENFFEWSPADIDYIDLSLDYRPTEQLRVEGRYQLQDFDRRSDGRTWACATSRASSSSTSSRARRSCAWSASTTSTARTTCATTGAPSCRSSSATPSPAPTGAALGLEHKRLRLDFLFSYQPVPGTVIFAGYGSRLIDGGRPRGRGLRREGDGFFLKFSYLFRV